MTRCIRLIILSFLIINAHVIFAIGQATTPWESPKSTENFIGIFLKTIARSSAFSSSQLDDMYTIRRTMAATKEKLDDSTTGSKSKFQTLNKAFASAMIDFVVSEEAGSGMGTKINAIKNALSSAFLETNGVINTEFVSEITNLIYALARTKSNEISSTSDVKLAGYKQKSLKQQIPTTSINTTETNRFVPQTEQGSLALASSVVLNRTGNNGSSFQEPSVTRPQELPHRTPSKQHSTVVSNVKGSVPTPSGSESQVLPPQLPSALGLQKPSGYTAETNTSTGTGRRLGRQAPSESVSPVTEKRGFEDNGLLGKRASSAGRTKTGDKEPNSYGLGAAKNSYALLSASRQPQAPRASGLEEKGIIGRQELSGSDGNGAKATASAAASASEFGINEKGQRSSEITKLQPDIRLPPEARSQQSEDNGIGSNKSRTIAKVPSAAQNAGGPQELEGQKATGKETTKSGAYGPGAAVASGSVPSSVVKGYDTEKQVLQGSARNARQRQEQSRQKLGNQVPSGAEGQGPNGYRVMGTSTAAGAYGLDSSIESQGESVIPGQESTQIKQQKPSSREPFVLGDKVPGNYGRATATAVARGYGSSPDSYGPQGQGQAPSPSKEMGMISRNPPVPTTQDREGYALKTDAGQYSPVRPAVVSQVSSSDSSIEISTAASSMASSVSSQPTVLSNSFNNVMSQVDASNTHLFSCDVIIQTLLEIISSLVHILESCSTGRFNFGSEAQYSSATSQSSAQIIH